MLHAIDPDSIDLTSIWVQVYANPAEHQRADYFRDEVLDTDASILRTARSWIAKGRPEDVRTFGRNFGTFYGLPWVRA